MALTYENYNYHPPNFSGYPKVIVRYRWKPQKHVTLNESPPQHTAQILPPVAIGR